MLRPAAQRFYSDPRGPPGAGWGQDTQGYQAPLLCQQQLRMDDVTPSPVLWDSLWNRSPTVDQRQQEMPVLHSFPSLGSWAVCRAELLSPGASVTNHHAPSVHRQMVISHRAGGRKSRSKMPANAVSDEHCLPGSRTTTSSLCPQLVGRQSPLS